MKRFLLTTALCAVTFGFTPYSLASDLFVSAPEEEKTQETNDLSSNTTTAQEETELTFDQKLIEYNKNKPLQNPKFTNTKDILDRRIADNQNKIVGEVKDIIIAQGGKVAFVQGVFNRLHLQGEVLLNYADMQIGYTEDGYSLGFKAEEIKEIHGELPKELSADKAQKQVSLKDIKGKRVKTKKGDQIGEIEQVLFSEDGSEALAAYVIVDYGPVKNVEMAVPFEALTFSQKNGRPEFFVDTETAMKILQVANAKK